MFVRRTLASRGSGGIACDARSWRCQARRSTLSPCQGRPVKTSARQGVHPAPRPLRFARMLYYNTPMSEAAPVPASPRAAMRENARERVADARFRSPPALRMSAWGRLVVVAPVAILLWIGVFWALN